MRGLDSGGPVRDHGRSTPGADWEPAHGRGDRGTTAAGVSVCGRRLSRRREHAAGGQGGKRAPSQTDHAPDRYQRRSEPEVLHVLPGTRRRACDRFPGLEVRRQGRRPLALHSRHQAGHSSRGQGRAVELRGFGFLL